MPEDLVPCCPHTAWPGFVFQADHRNPEHDWHLNGNVHALHMSFQGEGDVRWIAGGKETRYSARPGMFHYLPADGRSNAILASLPHGVRAYTVFLTSEQLSELVATEHVYVSLDLERCLRYDDPVLSACMRNLAETAAPGDRNRAVCQDAAARRLIMRLLEVQGVHADWQVDTSGFDNVTFRFLVEYLDAHLQQTPSLSELARLVGLSPGHFAEKFRRTSGISVLRFLNRRRLLRALQVLQNPTLPLDTVASDLGFSSQSHFTRLFSSLTGMTPAKYQKQFRKVVG